MTLWDKIQKIQFEKGLGIAEFCDSVGFSRGLYYDIKNGKKTELKPLQARMINEEFPEYTQKWLMDSSINGVELNEPKSNYINNSELDSIVNLVLDNEKELMQHKVFKLWLETKIQAQIIDRFKEI